MTQAGSVECGAPGDFLHWDEADWNLTSHATKTIAGELEGPCRRESRFSVFTADFGYHGAATNDEKQSGCMEHCQKLGNGLI